jgi:hypothetical protein
MATVIDEITVTLTQNDVIAAIEAYIVAQVGTVGSNFVVMLDTNTLADPNPATIVATATWTKP